MIRKRIATIISLLLMLILIVVLYKYDNKPYDQFTITDKIKNKQIVNMLIVGDSIGGSMNPDDWCTLVKSELDEILPSHVQVDNISVPGWKSFAGMVNLNNYRNKNDSNKYIDLIVLCFGQNDTEDNTFPVYYEGLIRACKKNYPYAGIATVLESSIQSDSMKRKAIIELCNYYKIPYADMLKAYKESGKEYVELTEDWIHPNAEGKALYAKEIGEIIKSNFIESKFTPTALETPMYSEALKYDSLVYLRAEDLKTNGNTVYVDIDEGLYSGLGIDIQLSDHTVKFDINNQSAYEISWENSYQARRIVDVDTQAKLEDNIVIKFEKSEDVDAILGIVLYGNK